MSSPARMDFEKTARCLAELGSPLRLRIFGLLVRAGHDGLAVGELRQMLDVPASTLAFHLRGMVEVGLVRQERQGREVRNRADFDQLNSTLDYFRDECCKGVELPARRKRG